MPESGVLETRGTVEETVAMAEHEKTSSRPNGSVATVLGLAFYWPFLRHFELVALCSNYANPSATAWSSYTHIVLPLACFLLLGVVVRGQIARAIVDKPLAVCMVSALGTFGYALLFAAPFMGHMEAARLAGCLLVALSYASLTFSWMRSISLAPTGNPFVCLVASFALSCMLSLLANVSGPATLPLMAAGPLVSGSLWFVHQRKMPALADNRSSCKLDSHKLPLALMGVFTLFLVVGRTVAGVLLFGSSEILLAERCLAVGISCGVLLVLAATMRKSKWDQLIQFNWSLLALLFLVCLVLLIVDSPFARHLGTGGIEACLNCFEITLWVLLVKTVRAEGADPIAVFGLATLVVRLLPNYMGKVLIPSLTVGTNLIEDHIVAFIALMALLLAAVTVLFLNARLTRQLMPQETNASNGENAVEQAGAYHQHNGKATEVAHNVGLTPRETDVMTLMARGYSYQKIAGELGVSVGTVQNHIKHIYRKANVHTRQELIDLVS